jgi:hypothetical protein
MGTQKVIVAEVFVPRLIQNLNKNMIFKKIYELNYDLDS